MGRPKRHNPKLYQMDVKETPKEGRDSKMNEELLINVRMFLLNGMEPNKICDLVGITKGTWDLWKYRNFRGFRLFLQEVFNEKILGKAKGNLEELLDCKKVNIKADMTKFALETLGKDQGFSKRNELTGANGRDLMKKDEVNDLINDLRQKCDSESKTSIGLDSVDE